MTGLLPERTLRPKKFPLPSLEMIRVSGLSKLWYPQLIPLPIKGDEVFVNSARGRSYEDDQLCRLSL